MKNRRISLLVENSSTSAVVLAIAGFAAIIVGVHQGVLHVAPGYQGTINAGADVLERREWLLGGMGAVGVAGAAVSLWRTRLSVLPIVVGGIVLFEAVRTMIVAANGLPYPLYTETTLRLSGEPVVFIFGAQPFLLLVGGVLLVGAGFVGLRGRRNRENCDDVSSPSSGAA